MTEYLDTLKARFNLLSKAAKTSGTLYDKCLITLYDMNYELLLAHYSKRATSPAQLNKYVTLAAAYVNGCITKEEFDKMNKLLEPLTQVLDETIKATEEKDFDYD